MLEQKNLIIAVALSLVIIVGFEFLAPKPPKPVETAAQSQTVTPQPTAIPSVAAPGMPSSVNGLLKDRPALLADSKRVTISTPSLSGSLSLTGSRIDDLTLTGYRETAAADSARIVLLSPKNAADSYYAEFGWVPAVAGMATPGTDTTWIADRDTLTDTAPVTLSWDNGQGLVFKRVISVDRDFLFTITDTVENKSGGDVTLFPYGLVARGYTPHTADFYILHEGPVGVFDGTLKEIKYKALKDEKKVEHPSTGGWVGITDKYWLTAIDLDNATESKARFLYTGNNGDRYQVDYLGAARQIAAGASVTTKTDFFAGAKQVNLLDRYAEEKHIDRFDLAIDFGWFYFLTKPFFYALQTLHGWLGNFGLAIVAFTVALRLVLYPLANKSYIAMNKMKLLQPKVKELQERFKDDRQRLNQEMMAVYKAEGANPLAGCLPILLQIPIFFALYKVLFISIEMRHTPFYLWITDLSAPDPTSLFNLFGLIPWTPPSFLHIGVLPLIMGVTMYLQQKMNPAPADPIQARMMNLLPIVFTVMLAGFPAGLVLYWTCNNTLSILQQWSIARRYNKLTSAKAKA